MHRGRRRGAIGASEEAKNRARGDSHVLHGDERAAAGGGGEEREAGVRTADVERRRVASLLFVFRATLESHGPLVACSASAMGHGRTCPTLYVTPGS